MNERPFSEEELRLRLASLRVAPPKEDEFRARLFRELEAVGPEPRATLLPFRRKTSKVLFGAVALAVAGVAAAATLRMVFEESRVGPAIAERAEPSVSRPSSETKKERPIETPPKREGPAKLEQRERPPERLTTPRQYRSESPARPLEVRTVTPPSSAMPIERNLQRLELPRLETPLRRQDPATRSSLDRNPSERRGGEENRERAAPDRSLTKVGPGGTPREERMTSPGLPERRPGGPPSP